MMRVLVSMVLAILLGVACGGSTRSTGSSTGTVAGGAGAGDGAGGTAGMPASSSGGASAGGSATEGGAAGGASGTGGTGGCTSDADCTLYADCCTGCIAVPTDYEPEVCPEACVVTCPEAALARCVLGECLVEIGCNDSAPCPATHYCDYADDLCGRGDPAGLCQPRPAACAVPYNPVCGCGATSPQDDWCVLSMIGLDVDAELVATGDSCVPAITPDPAAMGVWLYGWTGDNLSFFEIALCPGGRALYLFAEAPDDPNAAAIEGTYIATSPTTFALSMEGAANIDGTVLEYEPDQDRLDRSPASDGYDPSGLHVEREDLTWLTPLLSCE